MKKVGVNLFTRKNTTTWKICLITLFFVFFCALFLGLGIIFTETQKSFKFLQKKNFLTFFLSKATVKYLVSRYNANVVVRKKKKF